MALRVLQCLLSKQGEAALRRASPRTAVELLKVAAYLEDSAWDRFQELNTETAEGLPRDGYDILDSLRRDPSLAPALVRLQGEMGNVAEGEA